MKLEDLALEMEQEEKPKKKSLEDLASEIEKPKSLKVLASEMEKEEPTWKKTLKQIGTTALKSNPVTRVLGDYLEKPTPTMTEIGERNRISGLRYEANTKQEIEDYKNWKPAITEEDVLKWKTLPSAAYPFMPPAMPLAPSEKPELSRSAKIAMMFKEEKLKLDEEGIESSLLDDPAFTTALTALTAGGFTLGREGVKQAIKVALREGASNITWGATDAPKIGKEIIKFYKTKAGQEILKQSDRFLKDSVKSINKPFVESKELPVVIENITKRSKNVSSKESKQIMKESIDFVKDMDSHLNSVPVEPIKVQRETVDTVMPKYASSVNLTKMNVTDEAKQTILDAADAVGITEPLSLKEIQAASEEANLLSKVMTRDQTKKYASELKASRDELAALSEKGVLNEEYFKTLEKVSSHATFLGRMFGSLRGYASPVEKTAMSRINDKLAKLGIKTDDLIKAGKGVDWNNDKEVTKFYRKFVKPSIGEIVDELRYINMLSSPKTHIVNMTTNALQGTVVRPATRIASAGIDALKSAIKGTEREYLFKQIPAYYKGMIGSTKEAFKESLKVIKGETGILRPDLTNIPTNSKITKPGYSVLRFLEAGDKFWRTLITGAEQEANMLVKGAEKGTSKKKALATAEELLFRKALDPENKTGQGKLLSGIDKFSGAVYKLRSTHPTMKWFIPFVQTPMNILKQGIEYSPTGIFTLSGNKNKVEQLGKMMVGSTVAGLAGWAAMEDKVTWAMPKDEGTRKAFIDSGREPYSIKIGKNWVSMSKLGPLAFPFALAAAVKWYAQDNPEAVTDNAVEKIGKGIAGMSEFYSDQSYIEGVNDLIQIIDGGDDRAANAFLATLRPAKQLMPLSGLQGWTARMVDDIYRNPSKDISMQTVKDAFAKDMPGLSKTVEPHYDLEENKSKRDYPIANAFSPFQVSKSNKKFEEFYQEKLDIGRERTVSNEAIKAYKEKFSELDEEDFNEMLDFIESQDPEDQKKAYKDVTKITKNKDIPDKYWYQTIKNIPPKIGAKIFVKKLNRLSEDIQSDIWAEAGQYGLLTPGFMKEYGLRLAEEL